MRTMPPEFLYNHNWTLLYRTLELIFSQCTPLFQTQIFCYSYRCWKTRTAFEHSRVEIDLKGWNLLEHPYTHHMIMRMRLPMHLLSPTQLSWYPIKYNSPPTHLNYYSYLCFWILPACFNVAFSFSWSWHVSVCFNPVMGTPAISKLHHYSTLSSLHNPFLSMSVIFFPNLLLEYLYIQYKWF